MTTITKSQLKSLVERSVEQAIKEQKRSMVSESSSRWDDIVLEVIENTISDWEIDFPVLMAKITGAKRKELHDYLWQTIEDSTSDSAHLDRSDLLRFLNDNFF